MDETPTWQEWLAISFLCTFGCEKLRELFSSEPVGIKQKLAVWCWNLWNPCDMAAVLFFLIGAALRFKQSTFEVGRVFYCINSIYWYLHILNILSVNKYLGRSPVWNLVRFFHVALYRSAGYHDGQNGKKHDLLRCSFIDRLDELRSVTTSNTVSKSRTELGNSERCTSQLLPHLAVFTLFFFF